MTQESNQATYFELGLQIHPKTIELATDWLFEQGATGVLEIEKAINFSIVAYFDTDLNLKAKAEGLNKAYPACDAELLFIHEKPVENWQDNWKEHFKPLEMGKRLVIRPPWEQSFPEKLEVIIYPGQGFGTGYHETTRLALESLEMIYAEDAAADLENVIDVGAGSGILIIAAMLLGSTGGVALEIEKEAVAEIPKNLALSGLDASQVTCIHGGPELQSSGSNLVIANITGDVLLELSNDLERLSNKWLLLSGIMGEYKKPLLERFEKNFELIHDPSLKVWNALLFKRKK